MSTWIVTGGAGFIGSNFLRVALNRCDARLVVVDKLTYAGNLQSLRDLAADPRFRFVEADIADRQTMDAVFAEEQPQAVVNFAAESHVDRSIEGPLDFVETNVLGVDRFLGELKRRFPCEVFAISTDKACRPASFMGASKRLMESVLAWHSLEPGSMLGEKNGEPLRRVASTRFANVAFSDGSLLAGFLHRLEKRQPLAGPSDVRRYFISEEEAGQLCLLTAALAETRQIFVPRRNPSADTRRFDQIAETVVCASGFEPRWYERIEDAAAGLPSDLAAGRYPCCFAASDTSGEKDLEEFVAPDERLAEARFRAVDVIAESPDPGSETIAEVVRALAAEVRKPSPATSRARIAGLLKRAVPSFEHVETGRNLDQKA